MQSVLLVIHLIVAVSIIVVVLLQRSEGGGLGVGSSGGMGAFATPRATADFLTRLTGILGACFFTTSLLLAIMASNQGGATKSILEVETGSAVVKTTPVTEPAKDEVPSAPVSK